MDKQTKQNKKLVNPEFYIQQNYASTMKVKYISDERTLTQFVIMQICWKEMPKGDEKYTRWKLGFLSRNEMANIRVNIKYFPPFNFFKMYVTV